MGDGLQHETLPGGTYLGMALEIAGRLDLGNA
jgi:hypothetical protein